MLVRASILSKQVNPHLRNNIARNAGMIIVILVVEEQVTMAKDMPSEQRTMLIKSIL
ncbi:MAG TPA: hypothetical protein VD815_03695 [Candidatus Saccharimonadales bacterium]|nr:hypothetical protein [Candidatus Saccharimonadales bacterium]